MQVVVKGKSLYFMGLQRQQAYFKLFQKMEPAAQTAIRDIYEQAHKGGDAHGRHVVMAMMASVRYPEIFKLTLMNLLVRLGLKQAIRNGDEKEAALKKEVLDDFHVALDEFLASDSLAAPDATEKNESIRHLKPLASRPTSLSEVLAFKRRAMPAVNRVKEASRKRRP